MGIFGPPNVTLLKAARNEKGLRRALRHKDEKVRLEAAVALCEMQQPTGPEYLKATLKNPDEAVALQAAIHLADFGDKAGLQILIRSLERKPTVSVAERLGKLQDTDATESLLDALITWKKEHAWERGSDWTLPRKLAEAIVAIEGVNVAPQALSKGEELILCELLAQHKDALINETVRVLLGTEDVTKQTVIVSLGFIADRATAPALFRNSFSALVLEKLLCKAEISDELIRQYPSLKDSADSRSAIVKIIASSPSQRHLQFLLNVAFDPDPDVATKAIDSLIGPESQFNEVDEAIERLTRIFHEPEISMSTKLHLARSLKSHWSPTSDLEKAYFALNENDVADLRLGPLAAPVFICGLMHPPSSKRSLRALEIMLRNCPQEILEEDLRRIAAIESIVSETAEIQSDGADGLYWGTDRRTLGARGIQKLAIAELNRRPTVG